MAQAGIDPVRLRFLPSQASLRTHLQALAQVDIALDRFPYQRTMTTLELPGAVKQRDVSGRGEIILDACHLWFSSAVS